MQEADLHVEAQVACKQIACKGITVQAVLSWQLMLLAAAQAGNRASGLGLNLQCSSTWSSARQLILVWWRRETVLIIAQLGLMSSWWQYMAGIGGTVWRLMDICCKQHSGCLKPGPPKKTVHLAAISCQLGEVGISAAPCRKLICM